MRVSGRLTEYDLDTCMYLTEHTRPIYAGGVEMPDDKLEFYEWLNHNGLSRRAFRSLAGVLKEFLMNQFEDYVAGKQSEMFSHSDYEHSFREWLALSDQGKRTLEDFSLEPPNVQGQLLSTYLGF